MVSSRPAIACILLSLSVAAFAQAQSGAAKEQTASISGKVTVKNKAVAGIVVVATETTHGSRGQANHHGATDDEGNYRISDIPAGNYHVHPLAPALVDKAQSSRLLTITAGESIGDIDFAMVPGGVITGRITNADGQPLVEESVEVVPVDVQREYMPHQFGHNTDDRGIYRAFGLRRGKYRVSVGNSAKSLPGFSRTMYSQTFYPSVTDISKATVIEVTEGSETKDIDIVVAGSLSTFTVSGRVIDGNGKPLSGIILGVQQSDGNGSTISSTGGAATSSNGEFRWQNVIPGKYTLFIAPVANSDVRADPLNIEVIDRDLTGLELKTKKGASLSGMVVLEGSHEKSVGAMLKGLLVFAWMEKESYDYDTGSRSVEVREDGSFKLVGLGSGNARLGFSETNQASARQFEILQLEHNGVVQPGGISIKEGEQVDGVRMIIRHVKLTGAIRGQVRIENGELPPRARIMVWVNFADQSRRSSLPVPEVDSRGRFLLERLPAGTYEVLAAVYESGKRLTRDEPKQVITVTENAVTEVNLTLKLKP